MRAQAESLRQLVFAGCGAKGMGYLGAVRALEETALLGGVERVAGTSSGALMAACLAVGATAEDLAEVVNPKELGQQLSRVPGLWELVQSPWRFGLRTSEPLEHWLGGRFAALTERTLGTARPDLTFADVAALAEARPGVCRRPYLVATNLNCLRAEVFSAETTPDVPLVSAVRYSIGIPAVLQAAEVDGSVLVDGALSWNYPFQLFSGHARPPLDPVVRSRQFGTPAPGATVGFVMSSRTALGLGDTPSPSGPRQPIDGPLAYLSAVFMLTTELATLAYLEPSVEDHTVFVDGCGVSPVDFTVSEAQHQQLIESGYQATLAWARARLEATTKGPPGARPRGQRQSSSSSTVQ